MTGWISFLPFTLLFFFSLSLSATEKGEDHGHDNPRRLIVATALPPLGFLIEEITKGGVTVETLLEAGEDPHTFELTPVKVTSLARVSLYIGSRQFFEDAIFHLLPSDAIYFIPSHHFEKSGEPHPWLSPRLLADSAEGIARQLSKIDSLSSKIYEANLQKLLAKIEALDKKITLQLRPFKGKKFFVYHPAYEEFAEAYDLEQVALEEDGKEPGPQDLLAFVKLARKENAAYLFTSPGTHSLSESRAVAKHMGSRMVVIDPIAKNVLDTINRLADTLEKAFDR